MESIYDFNMTQILGFSLIFLRMIGFVVTAPILGVNNVPVSAKLLLAFTMSFIFFPQVVWSKLNIDFDSMIIMSLAVKEIFVGIVFGYLARLFFMTIAMAGQMISVSMGISAAQLFNPSIGETSSAFDQFYGILAILFFFAIQGHHALIGGIFGTFELIPLQSLTINLQGFEGIGAIVQKTMVLAVKMSAPVVAAILLMNLSVGVIGRAVPQINILITSLPINVLVGLFVVFISLPLMIWQMAEILNITTEQLYEIIESL